MSQLTHSKSKLTLISEGKENKKKKDIDISKVKCWACQQMGHYAATCPKRKNKVKKGTATSTEVDQFAS